MSILLERIEQAGEIITPIGTLDWNMEFGVDILHSHLQYIRPSTQDDIEGEKLSVRNYSLDHVAIIKNDIDNIREALLYVLVVMLKQLAQDGVRGKVNLVLYHRIENWTVNVTCSAYQ
jgi:hypothetical protein